MSVNTSLHHIKGIEIKEDHQDGYTYVSIKCYTDKEESQYFPTYMISVFGVDNKVKVKYTKG